MGKKSKKTDSKKSDAKKSDAKKHSANKADAKKADAKKADAKKADAKKADAKKADAKKADAKKSDAKKVEAEKAETPAASVEATAVRPSYKGADHPSAAELFKLPAGLVDLRQISTSGPDIGPRDKAEGVHRLEELGSTMRDLQEKLFAESVAGKRRSVLVVLQGMDTAGKDGVIDHVIGQLNPGGIRLASFKRPTAEELSHDFLWRIEKEVPAPGLIGVFNRSQYEDVLIQRVHNIVPKEVWSKRYAAINAFERSLTRRGVTIVKCFLHVSKEVQKERLLSRLDDPTKYWKFNPADIDERGYWDAYQQAYTAALAKCTTVAAPWYVIPSDHKWYRNWAIGALITETLQKLDPQYPAADFDIDEQRQRLEKE